MSKKRNKRRTGFRPPYSRPAVANTATATAVMTMPAPAGYAEPEYIPPAPEGELTPEQEEELLAEIRNLPAEYPTDEEIAAFQAEYPSEPSYEKSEEEEYRVPYQITAMNNIFTAVNELNDGDFTDSSLALSEKAEEIAEYGRQAFILHDEYGNEVVNLDMVYEFNQVAVRTPTKYGILSVFIMKDGNADCGWEENWQSIDILMVEKERWDTAYRIEDFGWCVPIANKGMTTAELFDDTRKRYAETILN